MCPCVTRVCVCVYTPNDLSLISDLVSSFHIQVNMDLTCELNESGRLKIEEIAFDMGMSKPLVKSKHTWIKQIRLASIQSAGLGLVAIPLFLNFLSDCPSHISLNKKSINAREHACASETCPEFEWFIWWMSGFSWSELELEKNTEKGQTRPPEREICGISQACGP